MLCNQCSAHNPDHNNFCIQCGAALRVQDSDGAQPRQAPATFRVAAPDEYPLCPACQQPQEAGVNHCTACGADMNQRPKIERGKPSGSCLGRAIKRAAMVAVSFGISTGVGLLVREMQLTALFGGVITFLVGSAVPMVFGVLGFLGRMLIGGGGR